MLPVAVYRYDGDQNAVDGTLFIYHGQQKTAPVDHDWDMVVRIVLGINRRPHWDGGGQLPAIEFPTGYGAFAEPLAGHVHDADLGHTGRKKAVLEIRIVQHEARAIAACNGAAIMTGKRPLAHIRPLPSKTKT